MYTCPMHPEIRSEKSGKCPKCGMDLVLESSLKDNKEASLSKDASYIPLITIIGLIFLVAVFVSLKDFNLNNLIHNFMAGFFITFAGFKITLDLFQLCIGL